MVWLTLNLIMVSAWVVGERIAPGAWTMAGITIPFIVISVLLGDHFHHKLPEQTFRKAAYVLLLVAGISLVYKSLPMVLSAAPAI